MGEHLKDSKDRYNFYEIRPFLFIMVGFVGLFNSLVSVGSPGMILLGQVCGAVLFVSSAQILKWRRDYRRRVM